MSTLDDIAEERQRLAERLARVDAERAKLAEQLAELEAAERVFSRFAKPKPGAPRRGRRPRAAEGAEPAAPRRGRQGRRVRGGVAAPPALSLGDAALRAVQAHGEGITAEDVRNYLAAEFGMQVRPNHLGMALQRHRRAGRLEQRGSRWWAAAQHGRNDSAATP